MKRVALAAALMVSFIGTATYASAVTLSQVHSDVFDGGGRIGVSIQSPETVSGLAGGMHLTDGATDFLAWCLDISNYLFLPSNYVTTNTPFTNTQVIGATQLANIERLFETALPTVLANNTNSTAGNKIAGGFQLALWELLYDTNPGDAGSGVFRATSSTAGAIAQANAFIANVLNPLVPIVQAYQLTFYQSTSTRNGHYSQDLVTVTPVPLPAAGLLLGGGLLGLFALRRRKRPEPQAA
jgi:hypothetical protein